MTTREDFESFVREHPEISYYDSAELSPDPPARLFHYTSADGLLGILKTNSLWATNMKFLNDYSELKYGIELFTEVCNEVTGGIGNALRNDYQFVQTVMAAARTLTLFRTFVLALSDAPNQLSQWVAYGSRGTGYSLGLNSSAFERFRFAESEVFFLFKVCYDRDRQKELLKNLIDRFVARIAKGGSEEFSPSKRSLYVTNFLVRLQNYLIAFKNSAFQEEREWRLVCIFDPNTGTTKHLEFRSSGGFISPYVVLKPVDGELLPIEVVCQGPRVSSEIGAEAVRDLLLKYGYKDTKVEDSGIPLRTL